MQPGKMEEQGKLIITDGNGDESIEIECNWDFWALT